MVFFHKLNSSPVRGIRPNFTVFLIASLVFGNFALNSPAYAASPDEEGKAIFEKKCIACHSIGGGRGVGPDLEDVASNRDNAWLTDFIAAPDKLIAGGDPIAKELVQQYGLPMPNVGVSEDDAHAIIAYLKAQSAGILTASSSAPITQVPAITAGDPGRGEDMFTGRRHLENGGPACLACHNVNAAGAFGGGTVGKDLTASHSTLGEAGLQSIMKSAPFPVMTAIYSVKPLIDTEIADITAFLKGVQTAPQVSSQSPDLFLITGGVGALVIIGLFQLAWRGRLSGVRRSLVKGGSK